MRYAVSLPQRDVFAAWRTAARQAISHRIAPDDIDWNGQGALFASAALPEPAAGHAARVPADFIALAGAVIWHSAPDRFPLLYQALWRLDQHDGTPLSPADPLGRRLALMAASVKRDIHKMHAFVRFRELPAAGPRRSFGAWFEPAHHTLEPGAAFFVERFADMDWLIATPALTARFTDGVLDFDTGGERPDLPDDATEALWATYFANIFNPARVKLAAMRAEMPKKYWHNLPETRLIPAMLADAEARVERMRAAGASAPRPGAAAVSTRYRATLPIAADTPETLEQARRAARQCRRCGLCEAATQTVWGEGDATARIMIVGEQAGDQEDLAGRPFIGPAGQLLRSAMRDAGLAPERTWLTNAVKHFKFTPRGKRRLHRTPDRDEIAHCRWWLGLELAFIQPQITLALGASAAFALTNDARPIAERRGGVETGLHRGPVLMTWHPAYILRTTDPAMRDRLRRDLVADIGAARIRASSSGLPNSPISA
ncbi:UdgX family uracil-DNA binding protein [Hephaestia sp. GCM10023244]|uniref:UdgX family uracil-DNA binding protein n=1 Tax=unclassified Hephaestia TaxID=2631281 RepID=UPI0020772269|nr:UdgX family uracil-DNA binding protein [Hephaestia sp. MAHUQ-44]MCM8730883.1 UdgX family uracil-DNA binding protein [Hephaestia sp. MAHUQ-44]